MRLNVSLAPDESGNPLIVVSTSFTPDEVGPFIDVLIKARRQALLRPPLDVAAVPDKVERPDSEYRPISE